VADGANGRGTKWKKIVSVPSQSIGTSKALSRKRPPPLAA